MAQKRKNTSKRNKTKALLTANIDQCIDVLAYTNALKGWDKLSMYQKVKRDEMAGIIGVSPRTIRRIEIRNMSFKPKKSQILDYKYRLELKLENINKLLDNK